MPHSKKASKAKKAVQAPQPQPPKGVQKPVRQRLGRQCKQERLVVSATLPCDLEKRIKKRPDNLLLAEHVKAILAHKAKYKARLKAAKAKLKRGDASEQHAMPAHKAKVTEAKGEYEATVLMIDKYVKAKGGADYQILWTFSAGTGIDQLWYSKAADTFIVVEAKGPGATLSTNAAKGDQMSKQWVRACLNEVNNSKNSDAAAKKVAKRMLNAMDNGPPPKILGRVIEALPGGGAKEVGCPDKGIYHHT